MVCVDTSFMIALIRRELFKGAYRSRRDESAARVRKSPTYL
jgi:hypothetical protein